MSSRSGTSDSARGASAAIVSLATAPGLIAPQLVGQATGRDGDQPAAWILRQTLVGPLDGGGQQRLLHRVLARVEVPVPTDEGAEHLRRELPQQVLDARRRAHISSPPGSMIGRTSIAQYRASGQRAAISVARSGVSHWTMQ